MRSAKISGSTFLKMLITVTLTLVVLLGVKPVSAATAPSITVKSVTNLTTANAQINGSVSNPSKVRLKKAGFILYNANGTQLANKYDSINYTLTSFNAWFDLNSYYGQLSAGTTYKYKFYVMNSSGKYYYSALNSFTTITPPSITVKAVSNLTTTNAQINASISNPSKTKITKVGFILYNAGGTQLTNMYDTVSYTLKSFNAWYDLNNYHVSLSANTTYKYRFYVVNGYGTYYTGVYNFTTSKAVSSTSTSGASSSATSTSGASSSASSTSGASSSTSSTANSTSAATVVAATTSAAVANTSLAAKIKAFTTDPRWKNGAVFTNPIKINGVTYKTHEYIHAKGAGYGYGCNAYARDFIRYLSGNKKLLMSGGKKFKDPTQIRMGDVIKLKNKTHFACVMSVVSVSDKKVVVRVCEGGYNWKKGKKQQARTNSKATLTKNKNGTWTYKAGATHTFVCAYHYSYNS